MKIRINSNFVIPGLEGKSEIDLVSPKVTLSILLEELSIRNAGRLKFLHPLTHSLDSTHFVLELNGLPNSGSKEALELDLKEGDIITINLLPLGGG
jgi:hypothetical protein